MSVIVQHYYLAAWDYCGQEIEDQFMTESSAKNALRAHYVSEHGPATDRENGGRNGEL
ncbi:hypothetical protein [Microbacterium sp. AR7-10]|uniref:hypothetical protein n=1 Tax=Microbacterium sp. AR7-10 TaxID=1891970 RepID=UPI000A72E3B4|nr:hypothetical protein [Microbacterium sp. AR7-10]